MSGRLRVVGLGAGDARWLTPRPPKVRRALEKAGRLGRALYVERGTMRGEQIMPLSECPDGNGPYFSMVLIPGQGRRL